jgi:flavin reductase (DIM6/NTAB) family NADH-FMN oxidoreductase RutF
MDPTALSTEEFGAFTAGLDYPMFVVTTTDGTERSGCLVGFTTQTSIDPPRFLACLSDKNHTFRVATGATLLAVHALADDQRELAELFGAETGDEVDKFAQCAWTAGPGGVPILDECPRHLVGRVLARWPLGDHVGFLLEPVEAEASPDERSVGDPSAALTLDDVTDLEPGHEA